MSVKSCSVDLTSIYITLNPILDATIPFEIPNDGISHYWASKQKKHGRAVSEIVDSLPPPGFQLELKVIIINEHVIGPDVCSIF